MNYAQTDDYIGSSAVLLKRSKIAVATAAVAILSEPPAGQNHAARIAWAGKALTDTQAMTRKMLIAIMANTTLQAAGDAMLDADLQFTVNGLVDVFSAIP